MLTFARLPLIAFILELTSLSTVLAADDATAESSAETQALLTEVQQAGFRYFYDFGHPVSGLAREGTSHGSDVCTIGATGMGCFNFVVGCQRGFATREAIVQRLTLMLRFLADRADRFHGAYPHWLNGTTGRVIPFSPDDDGADLVETAYLAQGLLAVREYFNGKEPAEVELRKLADDIWRGIEWDFFARETADEAVLLWHWSPRVEWKMNMPVRGFNECQIVYVLALASPTHAVDGKFYRRGWEGKHYAKEREHLGVRVMLGDRLEMPLFFTHYSYLGFDPHQLSFQGKSYASHFQDLCKVQIRYAQSKSKQFKGYGPLWGLTACLGPDGYRAFAPGNDHNGTIAPTAALSSMPYVPAESLACLRELNRHYSGTLWGEYGFRDAINPTRDWVAKGYLGIDVGPIAPMIENYRTKLCWNTFMKAPEIGRAMKILREVEASHR